MSDAGYYVWGNSATRFALLTYPDRRYGLRLRQGVLLLGHFGFWWKPTEVTEEPAPTATIYEFKRRNGGSG